MIFHDRLRAPSAAPLLPALLLALFTVAPGIAQDQPAVDAPAVEAPQQQPASPWASRCAANGRQDPLECNISQRAVTKQGQLVGSVTIRTIAGTDPVMVVSVPLGLYLGAGVSFDVDGANGQQLELETCDRAGCYAQLKLTEDTLNAFRGGQVLDIVFQNLNRQPVKLPMSLVGFTAAYDKVR
jgi:invasion protein IalB